MELTMREVLLTDVLPSQEKALREAIDWVIKARELVLGGRVTMDEIDQACPFNRGDDSWFYYVLLMNKHYKTLYGPYDAMITKGWTAKSQATYDGLVCANCYAAGGANMATTLRRCTRCRLVCYCGRSCQRFHYDTHRKVCNGEHDRVQRRLRAAPKFRRFELPATSDEPVVKLIARHVRDGYFRSSIVLFRDLDDGTSSNVRNATHEEPYAIVSTPIHDEQYRDTALGPNEACLDDENYPREAAALLEAKVIARVPGKAYAPPDRTALPIVRIDVERIELGDL